MYCDCVCVLFSQVNHIQKRYPTHVSDVAAVCCGIADRALTDPAAVCGIHHWSGNEMMTKYDIAVAIADIFGLPKGKSYGIDDLCKSKYKETT